MDTLSKNDKLVFCSGCGINLCFAGYDEYKNLGVVIRNRSVYRDRKQQSAKIIEHCSTSLPG